jgi:hypothetical protein
MRSSSRPSAKRQASKPDMILTVDAGKHTVSTFLVIISVPLSRWYT